MGFLNNPKYVHALLEERQSRECCILGIGRVIGGFEVRDITLRDYSTLKLLYSPLLPPFDVPSETELIQFLWLLNPSWSPSVRRRKKFVKLCAHFRQLPRRVFFAERRRKQNIRRMAKFLNLAALCRAFVEETFADAPPQKAGGFHQSYYSDTVDMLGLLGREHHLQRAEILGMTLKEIFQRIREIQSHYSALNGGQLVLGNRSDRVKQDALDARNAELRAKGLIRDN